MIHCSLQLLVAFWLALLPLLGTQVAKMPQITKPEGIYIGDDIIYVLEGTSIHMYKLKGYEYIGKFGKAGEGPGEIKKNPYGGPLLVVPNRGKIYVTSMGKLSIFSKTGEFIQEHRVNVYDSFYPFADRFVCVGSFQSADKEGKMMMAVYLADKDFNKGKPLYVSDFEVDMNFKMEFPITPFYPGTTEDQLFIIAGKDGFAIDAFDRQGAKQYRIEKREPEISVPASYREETEKSFKRNPSYAQMWDFFKPRITYKKYFPSIYYYFIDDGRIYVLTYKMKGDDRECIVLDLKGKELKRIFLPIPELYGMEFNTLFTASRSVFYQLREDDESETWALHTLSLK